MLITPWAGSGNALLKGQTNEQTNPKPTLGRLDSGMEVSSLPLVWAGASQDEQGSVWMSLP